MIHLIPSDETDEDLHELSDDCPCEPEFTNFTDVRDGHQVKINAMQHKQFSPDPDRKGVYVQREV